MHWHQGREDAESGSYLSFGRLLQVRSKTYTRPGTPGRRGIGHIAEETDALGLKHLVAYDKDGKPDGLSYDRMVLYLVEIA